MSWERCWSWQGACVGVWLGQAELQEPHSPGGWRMEPLCSLSPAWNQPRVPRVEFQRCLSWLVAESDGGCVSASSGDSCLQLGEHTVTALPGPWLLLLHREAQASCLG